MNKRVLPFIALVTNLAGSMCTGLILFGIPLGWTTVNWKYEGILFYLLWLVVVFIWSTGSMLFFMRDLSNNAREYEKEASV